MFVRCENEAANKLKMLSSRISKDGKAATDKVRKVRYLAGFGDRILTFFGSALLYCA